MSTRSRDTTLRCMGSDIRLVLEATAPCEGRLAALEGRAVDFLRDFDARLSRFRLDSELSALNADPRRRVPAGRLLRAWLRSALWAAERSGGLVDPTLTGELEAAGYDRSLTGHEPAPLGEALAAAPPRRPAAASENARWRAISIDDEQGWVQRPPGLRLDSGGTGKGLAADAVAHILGDLDLYAVDCGGDIAVGGRAAVAREIEVEHPLTGEIVHTLTLTRGGVATSGLDRRIWRQGSGFAHHLLDPSTGRPAWTGLIGVTALGSTALEAETTAKTALLGGPGAARRLLGESGGIVFHEDGDAEICGAARQRPRVHVRDLVGGRR